MIIANPIYDTVFKRMMENERVAKFFIGTLLEQQIESVEVKPQEFTYIKDLDQNDPEIEKYINARLRERFTINVMRLDFIATIKTETGEFKKVLIEIQKAKNQIDLMRFRNYLGEQYKKEDKVNNEKTVLPITTIYILGFTLPEIETACLKVERNYKDLISKDIIHKKSDFVEKLTHDSFIVQVDRITNNYQTKLDKLLSVFEQNNFTDDKKITKQFSHPTDTEDVKILTDILHHSGTNPEERKLIEIEQEAWRTVNAMFEDKEKELLKKLDEKDKALGEMAKQLEELKRKLGEE
jgi:molybdopterin converting factor small subunit